MSKKKLSIEMKGYWQNIYISKYIDSQILNTFDI